MLSGTIPCSRSEAQGLLTDTVAICFSMASSFTNSLLVDLYLSMRHGTVLETITTISGIRSTLQRTRFYKE